jgi:hypothetical protein
MHAFVQKCVSLHLDISVRQFISKESFRHSADANHLGELLLLAGLPE